MEARRGTTCQAPDNRGTRRVLPAPAAAHPARSGAEAQSLGRLGAQYRARPPASGFNARDLGASRRARRGTKQADGTAADPTAARANDEAEHARLRRLAEQSAERLGDDRLVVGNNFGPGDVTLQHVGELVELGQPAEALQRAEQLPPDPLPQVDRRAVHRIHQAKARFLQRKDRETTELLMEAWAIAPELTPNEQMTCEMVRAMVERARYRYNPPLRVLAD